MIVILIHVLITLPATILLMDLIALVYQATPVQHARLISTNVLVTLARMALAVLTRMLVIVAHVRVDILVYCVKMILMNASLVHA